MIRFLENHVESFSPLQNFREGEICAAKFAVDQQFYRARIIEYVEKKVMVHFIDFGNNCFSNELRELPEVVVNVPQLAIHCQLKKGKTEWNFEHLTNFLTLVKDANQKFEAIVIDKSTDKWVIQLFIELDGVKMSMTDILLNNYKIKN